MSRGQPISPPSASESLDDVARFSASDDDPIVIAALCCPICLRQPSRFRLTQSSPGHISRCGCDACGSEWSVALDDEQARRLKNLMNRWFFRWTSPPL